MRKELQNFWAIVGAFVLLASSADPASAFCLGDLLVESWQTVRHTSCPTPSFSKTLHYKCADACGYTSGRLTQTISGNGECFKEENCIPSIVCEPLEGEEVYGYDPPSVSFSIVERRGYYTRVPCNDPECYSSGVVSATVECSCYDSDHYQLRDCGNDPIIISLRDSNYALTDRHDGVAFDLNADGIAESVPWTSDLGDEAFLVLDRNGNGIIDDGTELFGDVTPQHRSDRPNGFLALAIYDEELNGGNEDRVINAEDAIFNRLRLWTDNDHDGISQQEELRTLTSAGLVAISLDYRESKRADKFGNEFRYWVRSEWLGGKVQTIWNVFLTAE